MRHVWMKFWKKESLKLLGILFVFLVFIWFNMAASAGISGIHEFIDTPPMVSMVFFTIVVLWLSGMGKDFLNGLWLAVSKENNFSRIKLQRACNAVKYTRTLIFLEAVIEIFIGVIDFLYHADDSISMVLGPALAVIFIGALYTSMAAVLLTILSAKLENMLVSYMEEPEAEISVEEAQMIYFKLRSLGLTDREAEVARLVSCDMTNREIGQMLYISDTTVKKHITHILDKTKMADREELTEMIRTL